jgi:hypothetical protein
MEHFDLIELMVKKATEAGMLAEVVHAYGEYRAKGEKATTAVPCALWDYQIELG